MDRVLLKKYPLAKPLEWRVAELETIWKKRKLNRILPSAGLSRVMAYHTPIAWVEKGSRIKWRYGVEYEIALHRLEDGDTGEEWELGQELLGKVARAYCDTHFRRYAGGVTRDQSLDRGFELVLPPLSIPSIIHACMGLVNDPYIKAALNEFDTAGLHVTVDPFSTFEQQQAFHDFWNDDQLYEDFLDIIGRDEQKYCMKRTKPPRIIAGMFEPDTLRTHHNRCNVRNGGAMEVRVFRAIYNEDALRKQLVFVDLVNKAVRRGMTSYTEIGAFAHYHLR